MEEVKLEPAYEWECPKCKTLNYVGVSDLSTSEKKENSIFRWCENCDQMIKGKFYLLKEIK